MGQVIGSCAGAFSATCLTALLSPKAGDFTSGPQWIPDSIDCCLILIPFILLYFGMSSAALNWAVLSLITLNLLVVIFTENLHNRFYGIRIAVPITVGLVAGIASQYYSVDLSDTVSQTLALVGSATLGFIVTICVSDVGILANLTLRTKLSKINDERIIRLAIQLMLVAVSVYLILFSVVTEMDHWFYVTLIFVTVILSVVKSDHQRGSIVSAALTVYLVTAVAASILPIQLAVVLTTVYNALFLNNAVNDHELLPSLPLLDDGEQLHRMTPEQTSNVRFKFSAYNMILLAFFSTGADMFEADLFLQISLVTSAWVLVAPLVLRNRQFPF